jgi:hypothetical protein
MKFQSITISHSNDGATYVCMFVYVYTFGTIGYLYNFSFFYDTYRFAYIVYIHI